MAHAYRSVEDDQIIVTDERRPDLDALARWERIDVDEAHVILAAKSVEGAQLDEDEARLAAYIAEHSLTAADVLAALVGSRTAEHEVISESGASDVPAPEPVPAEPEAPTGEDEAAPETAAKPARARRKAGDA